MGVIVQLLLSDRVCVYPNWLSDHDHFWLGQLYSITQQWMVSKEFEKEVSASTSIIT